MKIRYGDQEWQTYVEIDGYEHDSVAVMYYTSRAEPDVNHAGDCYVTGVYLEDQGDQMPNMTDDEIDQLQLRVDEHENSRHEDTRY